MERNAPTPLDERDAAAPAPTTPGGRAAGTALVLAMAAGSILMWIGAPLGWLWVGSRMTTSTQAQLGPYVLVLAGTVVTMFAFGKGLGAVNRLHLRVTGRLDDRPERATWLRSMRGERQVVHDRGVLDRVMLVSVSLALVLFLVWFFAFAGSSIPV